MAGEKVTQFPGLLKNLYDRLAKTTVVGADVSSSTLRVAEVSSSSGQLTLRRCGMASISGSQPAQALRSLLSKSGISTAEAVFGVSCPGLVVKQFKLPPMPQKELKKAVHLEVEQEVIGGQPMKELAVDWHMLPSTNGSQRGIFAAVPKTVLSGRLELAKGAGLRPIIVDVDLLALWNAFTTLSARVASPSKGTLLVHVGEDASHVIIVKGSNDLVMVREFPVGSAQLAKGEFREWIVDIRDSFSYARAECGALELQAAYVTGSPVEPSVLSGLETTLGCPTGLWNPLDKIASSGNLGIERSQGPQFAVAIGLALRGLS